MPESSVAITAGAGTPIDTVTTPNGDHRQIVIVGDRGGYSGRVGTFRIPGRAGTTGQKLFVIHNATGSTVRVDVDRISVDLAQTVAKAVTVLPPIIRVSRITALPTGGTATSAKAADDTGIASSASVTVYADASAEGTSSATALAATAVATVTQEFASRLITAAGYEPADRVELLSSGSVTLRPLEGIVVELVYTLATQNPITDMWLVTTHWSEWTP